ncbi:uncharacterized protein Z519_03821 [Cladophialophora bantiana CBS 173.52]|uniref:Amidase domain-containing protein n=1 Tax=Cladophialophora bantiana (strain ATCC 10958 / CBS 173.52 / CDC B-1940 / NIH 8579) TaxID=1442370 RepID=A0A0D2G9D3_CLAB1|nr:uncharacterized protein Z519_03821 [Cladophialophora bantiana CBS 173.52]KIW95237.1 hypothetical protein Z519_03821 [Cladophialophora bantiana CBS 173.52]
MPLVAWENRAAAKRASLLKAIPSIWHVPPDQIPVGDGSPAVIDMPGKYLSEDEFTITETAPMDTLAHIHAGIWSCEDVVSAYCHRAALCHQFANCLTEVLFEEAVKTARELDQYRRETGGLKGPLHGLPVSFMDRFRVSGTETAAGFISWLGPKETDVTESLIVRHMRALGAIPFCKTNMPQSMMLAETANNIHGCTNNPYSALLSSGGAAGGEGALLAMKGSPFGWATEFAGSARIPAAFSNLFSLKVSSGRLPSLGVASSETSLPSRNSTIAIMSWDFGLLQHIAKLSLGATAFEEDPSWIDMPWREAKVRELTLRRPTFAVLECDGYIQPQPPIRRALRSIVQCLRRANYQVVEWKPPSHATPVETYFKIIGADGAQATRQHIKASGEPPVPMLRDWYFHQPTQPLSLSEYLALMKSLEKSQTAYQRYWKSTGKETASRLPVDGVIMPVCANAACCKNKLTYYGYSAIVNVLDFAAVSFPAGFIDRHLDPKPAAFVPLGREDESVNDSYDNFAFHGAPVGLQLMTRRTEEEKALKLVEIILQAQAYSLTPG